MKTFNSDWFAIFDELSEISITMAVRTNVYCFQELSVKNIVFSWQQRGTIFLSHFRILDHSINGLGNNQITNLFLVYQ